ncbi:MAG: ABC transporter transmembrane domain-containing protein [Pseudonocardiaceae bacterium]
MRPILALSTDGLDHRSPARFILALVGQQKASTLWGAVTAAVWMSATALLPAVIGRAIDRAIVGNDTGELVWWSMVILLLGVLRMGSSVAFYRQSLITRVVSGALTLRLVTRHITRLGASLSRRRATDDLIATSTTDITAIGVGLQFAGRIFGSIAAIAAVTIAILAMSLPLGLIVLVTVPVLMGISSLLLRPLHHRQDVYRSLQGRLAGHAVDIASGLRVLKGIGGERTFAARFRAHSGRLRLADADVARAEADLAGSRVLIPSLITIVVTYTAALFALHHRLTIGEVITFYGFATSLLMPLTDFMDGTSQMTRAMVAARRVTSLLNEDPSNGRMPDPPASGPAPRGKAALVENTSGLVVPPSTFMAVACAGSPHAGTIARRLTGFEDSADSTLGGERLSSLPIGVVRSRILLGLNSDRFFTGTIRDEIDPDETADDAQIQAALQTACATDIVDALPEGTNTQLTGRGRTFSGGQLQRLRLCRALVKGSEFTVLVEPTNAVDAYTEYRMAENLARFHAELSEGKSTVMFTVSPLLLHRAQQVVYMEDGHVVTAGTHDELLVGHPGYRLLVAREEAR